MNPIKLLLTIITFLFLTSCTSEGSTMRIMNKSDEEIANDTFKQVVNAIENHDANILMSMFSKNAQNQVSDLHAQANSLISFVQGDIIDFSNATEAGIRVETDVESSQKKKIIESSFCLKTGNQQYYIAIKECTTDTFDEYNEGVTSIYIINANDWKEDCIFRGNGEWKVGIYILETWRQGDGLREPD